MHAASSFRASVALILDEIKHIKELRQSSNTKRLAFAIHLCLVAHDVRLAPLEPFFRTLSVIIVDSTGYLVDAVSPPHPAASLSTLLSALRRKSTVFQAVVLWHHAPTSQSFVVHVPRLQARITALLSGTDHSPAARGECIFVRLGTRPSEVMVADGPPGALREALEGMRGAMAASPDALVFSLSEPFTEEILIPLAAVVIDYPVAYVPAFPRQTSFLEREPLDVYTVSIRWTTMESTLELGGDHELLKFSCPQALASHHAELSTSTVSRRLYAKLAAVVERVGASIVVTHHTETLDRVAL